MVFSPAQLGAASLEVVHSSTGLPWWVSIPVTAVAARGLLLPLSLKARQASGNVLLLNKAFSQVRLSRTRTVRRRTHFPALFQSP